MNTSCLDEAIALTSEGADTYNGRTHPAYANMVGPYGGITAATLLNALMQHPARLGTPLSLTVNFCAAVADGAFRITARAVRTNRSTQHWTLEMAQDDGVVCTATAVTAIRRDTWSADDAGMPSAPPVETLPALQVPKSVEWVKRYDMRPVQGQIPAEWDGTGSSSLTRLWVRDAPARPLDYPGLTALADVFFPRIWLRRATPVPAGTVSFTVYLHAGDDELSECADGWLFAQAQAQSFRHGFFDQTAQLWSAQGRVLATTHQIVYFKS